MNRYKTCRVCGKKYKACQNTARTGINVFRWQEVACSPECGEKYLKKVLEDRAPSKTKKKSVAKNSVKNKSSNTDKANSTDIKTS